MINNNRFYYFLGINLGTALAFFNIQVSDSSDPINLLWTIPISLFMVGIIAKDMK